MTTATIAHLRIKLDDVEPAVVRRLEVPLTIRLDRLHLVLQAAMGWTNSHLYEIRARDVGWGMPDPDFGDGPLDAAKARLVDVLEDVGGRSLKYLYDFGDGWEHSIRIERIADALPGIVYPRLIEATGRCPPEDVGGPWGTASSSMPLPIPAMRNTTRDCSGSAATSIPLPHASRGSCSGRPHPRQKVGPQANQSQARLISGLRRTDTLKADRTAASLL